MGGPGPPAGGGALPTCCAAGSCASPTPEEAREALEAAATACEGLGVEHLVVRARELARSQTQ